MTRPEHLKASGLSAVDIDVLLDAVAAIAEPARVAFLWWPIVRDSDDDRALEAAVSGRADAPVTFNVRDLSGAAERFGMAMLSLPTRR